MSIEAKTPTGDRARQRGFSLVELMIAMAIGAALIGGIIQIFTSNNAAFRTQQSVSRMQESARFAFHFLSSEIRQAGYKGCAGTATNTNILDIKPGDKQYFLYGSLPSVVGYDENETLPASAPSLSKTPSGNSDILVIRRAGDAELPAADSQPSSPTAANFKVNKKHDFQTGDILTISDCRKSWTFQVTKANSTKQTVVANKGKKTSPGNTQKILQKNLSSDFSVSRNLTTVFFVAPGAGGEPALYRKQNEQGAEELVSGVEELDFEYGLDNKIQFKDPSDPACELAEPSGKGDGQVDEFKKASSIDDDNCEWARVIGVRVSMLVRSENDNLVPEKQTYQFDGGSRTSTDGRLRHVVNATVTLRNKVL